MNTVIDRADATLTAIGRALGEPAWATLEYPLADPPARESRPFHLRKVWPPDSVSCYMPWCLQGPDGWTGATRFTTADAAYRHIAEGVRQYADLVRMGASP